MKKLNPSSIIIIIICHMNSIMAQHTEQTQRANVYYENSLLIGNFWEVGCL